MTRLIRYFDWMLSGDYSNGVTYNFNVEIANQSRSEQYENLIVLLYVSRYRTQGDLKFWADTKYIQYLGPGMYLHINTNTGPIPKGERVSLTVEIYSGGRICGRPDEYMDYTNLYTGDPHD